MGPGSGWTWVDGTAFNLTQWATDQPDNDHSHLVADKAEDCLELQAAGWSDGACFNENLFICEIPTGKPTKVDIK